MLPIVYKQCREIFLKRGFNFCKWSTNYPEIRKMSEDDGVYDESERVTVLGMCLGVGDTLSYQRDQMGWT